MLRPARAAGEEDLAAVRELFREYAGWVGNALCFRSFERELADLPGCYAAPAGRLLLAFVEGHLAGCVALRPLSPAIAEMKRLYVRPAFRGAGLGRALVESIMEEARGIGYTRLRLDTLPSMPQAIAMYRQLGFREIAPYGGNPPAALCFERQL
ncbi:MAG: GNAT family N-acetyltransferase [Acidobacteriota bacterium]